MDSFPWDKSHQTSLDNPRTVCFFCFTANVVYHCQFLLIRNMVEIPGLTMHNLVKTTIEYFAKFTK